MGADTAYCIWFRNSWLQCCPLCVECHPSAGSRPLHTCHPAGTGILSGLGLARAVQGAVACAGERVEVGSHSGQFGHTCLCLRVRVGETQRKLYFPGLCLPPSGLQVT